MKDWFLGHLDNIVVKCPYCGAYTTLILLEEGKFGQGSGWYCPNCWKKLIPSHEKDEEEEVRND